MTCESSVAGKRIIVTGAGRGIGRAVALHLVNQGARVLANDLDMDSLESLEAETKTGPGALAIVPGSVADWHSVEGLIATALDRHGGLDGLVNNAGVHYTCPPHKEQPDAIRQLVEVNVTGAIFCGLQALRVFIDQGYGSLVNVTSGAHLGVSGQATYAASKGAIASLTYSWALDGQSRKVRVNAIAPLARTRMTEALPGFSGTAANSLGEVELQTPLFTYLLSDAAASINGQVIRFNGRELSLIDHPSVNRLRVTREQWQVSDIHVALNGPLRDAQSAPGLTANLNDKQHQ